MRMVVKSVFRSLSASATTNVTSLDSQSRLDMTQQLKRKDVTLVDSFSISASSSCRGMDRYFEMKSESLSPTYKLTGYEEIGFVELQDKECDYYPNNSGRGDTNILNMEVRHNSINNVEQNVNSTNIMLALKNIRFVHSIVFDQDFRAFLTTANYIQRLLHTKAVKRDLMQFISAAMYDLALDHITGKALTKDQVALLLSLTNIPINHIEDFQRMKSLLFTHLNNDLESISIIDYLQILLKVDFHTELDNLPESHSQLIEIACVLATSCELTHFTLACQAISLVNIAARHVSFHSSFVSQFSTVIDKFPMIFVSPVRLHQFAKLDNIVDENIKQCGECIVRYFSKYYDRSRMFLSPEKRLNLKKDVEEKDVGSELRTLIEETEEDEKLKAEERGVLRTRQWLDADELIEKIRKVSLTLNCQINGKQKQRHKRIKKKLSRQLKKYERNN